MDQLALFHEERPDLVLVVIDTLQIIRKAGRDYSYSTDYRGPSKLKRFADKHGITVLLIHHTRKMGDSDVMSTVSGTNGITVVADFTWVLAKDSASSNGATLTITGRDIERRKITLTFHDFRRRMVKDASGRELAAQSAPSCVMQALAFAVKNTIWEGRTCELMEEPGVGGISVAVFGKYLAQHVAFMARNGVRISKRRTSSGTLLRLEKTEDRDSNDNGNFLGQHIPVTAVTSYHYLVA